MHSLKALILLVTMGFLNCFCFAGEGSIDMSKLDPDAITSLKTEWYVFDNELVSPSEALNRLKSTKASVILEVPGRGFNHSESYPDQPGFGYKTYMLKLEGIKPGKYSGFGQQIYTSSRIFVFSEANPDVYPVLDQSVDIDNPEKSKPVYSTQTSFSFEIHDDSDHYILIQAANFYHAWGGMWHTPSISSERRVLQEVTYNTQISYLAMGAVLFVAIYNFSLFMRRPEDWASFALALCALSFVVRTFAMTTFPNNLFGDWEVSFEWNMKIVKIWYTLGSALFCTFLRLGFPKTVSRWYLWFTWLTQIPIYLYILLTPITTYYNFASPYLNLFSMVFNLLNLFFLIRAVYSKEAGAWYCLTGFLAAGGASINDLLWANDLPYLFAPMVGIGFSVFFVLNSQVLAQRFSVAFRLSEKLSSHLKDEVERQTRDIKNIMRHIKQGIFTIKAVEAPIGSNHSECLEQMLGIGNIESKSFKEAILDYMQADNDIKDQVTNALDACMGENILNFEVNSGLLPAEIVHQNEDKRAILEIDWNPVVDKNDDIESLLVCVRDVTSIRNLERMSRERERDMQMLIELVQISEGRFQHFITQTKSFINDNEELIEMVDQNRPEVVRRLFMNMHTIKGAARTLTLRTLSNIAHEIEREYQNLLDSKIEWDKINLLKGLASIQGVVHEYQNLGEEKLGWELDQKVFKIPSIVGEGLVLQLSSVDCARVAEKDKATISKAKDTIIEYFYTRMEKVVVDSFVGVDSMARDLGKIEPKVELSGETVFLNAAGVDLVQNLLVHLIRNSMDHGLETAVEREKLGKDPQGRVLIHSRIETSGDLAIGFSDDGAGLNLAKIRQRVTESGEIDKDSDVSDLQIAEYIFCSGLSTKDEASDISGRGVGMDAVRNFARAHNGDVFIELHERRETSTYTPFSINIVLPEGLWIKLNKDPLAQNIA